MTVLPPKDIGSAVPEGFVLPWNTTRTMADVWGLSASEVKAAKDGRQGAVVYRRYVARPAPDKGATDGR